MPHEIAISDALAREAQAAAERSEVSINMQIERWASLGQVLEGIITPRKRGGDSPKHPLSELIGSVDTEAGRQRLRDYFESGPFPRFEPVEGSPDLIRKIKEDGSKLVGKYVDRVFQPVDP